MPEILQMDAVPGGGKCGIGIGTWAYQTSKFVLRGRERKERKEKKRGTGKQG